MSMTSIHITVAVVSDAAGYFCRPCQDHGASKTDEAEVKRTEDLSWSEIKDASGLLTNCSSGLLASHSMASHCELRQWC